MTATATAVRAPVECRILVDGEEIADVYGLIQRVEVKMSRSAATTCEIQLDTFRDESGEWAAQDSGLFVPWKAIVVTAEFADHSEEVMRGYIRDVRVEYPQSQSAAVVKVTAQDDSLGLDRVHVRRTWSTEDEQRADGDIASEIASDNGLDADVDDGLRNGSLNQDGTSIAFLKRRAEANGFELFFRAGVLHFFAPRLEEEPQPTILVYAGRATNCTGFQATHDGHRPDAVRVVRAAETGVEPEETRVEPDLPLLGRVAAESSSMGLSPFEWSMNQPQGATRAEADARAQAAANENAWKVVATGELDGALYGHVLLTHGTVDVDGVGSTYGGRYYVDEVTHSFSIDGYRQRFKLLRNATGQQV